MRVGILRYECFAYPFCLALVEVAANLYFLARLFTGDISARGGIYKYALDFYDIFTNTMGWNDWGTIFGA